MILKVPVEILPWLKLGFTFFKLAPMKAELGTGAPEPDPCRQGGNLFTAPTVETAAAIWGTGRPRRRWGEIAAST
ncbi:hypothetical protein, partial [Streptomyces sp. HNS054]|uniref:hypothetical protein n=1 Tax=Streptomyces sp. HNS054 TaxID=1662446 RepID=UPI001F182988